MSLLLARRSQPCPWVQIMSFWVNRLILFVPYEVYFETPPPNGLGLSFPTPTIIRFVIEMMDWLFFRQSIWYCIYLRQIWLVKGICISFPHLNLHPTFHPPGGALCTSYLSDILYERAREDPSIYPPLQKPPFTAPPSPNIILPRPRPDATIEKISA